MLLLKNTVSPQSDFSVLKWIVCLDYWIISCFDFTYGCVQEDGFGIFLMTLRYTEKKKLPFSAVPDDDQHLPDIHLGLYNHVLVFDLVSKAQASKWVSGRVNISVWPQFSSIQFQQ
jgi:hypothetical protein